MAKRYTRDTEFGGGDGPVGKAPGTDPQVVALVAEDAVLVFRSKSIRSQGLSTPEDAGGKPAAGEFYRPGMSQRED